MENKFHGLPPLKRFRLIQQQQQNQQHENDAVVSFCLPAKKRKESRDLPQPTTTTVFCLPAKKRVWALQPFDLNVEYKPPLDEEEEEENNPQKPEIIPIQNGKNQFDVSGLGEKDEIQNVEEEDDDDDDDGIVCAVCQSTDGDPTDPIVFCDGCDLMVHSSCFGSPLIKGVPEGDWFCTQCLASQSPKFGNVKPFSCCLCPLTGGVLKPTTDGRWAHVVCALFVPEVFFADPEGREGIDCSKVPHKRWEQSCYVCEKASGCVIDCSEPKCSLAFHVTCGVKEDLCIEYKEGRNKGAIVAGFCKNHTELWKKQQQTGKFKIVARDENKK